MMYPSSAWLGSAQIQLKLEAFQLGSACAIFGTAHFAKKLAKSSYLYTFNFMEVFLKYDFSINIIQILVPSRYQTNYQNHLYSIPLYFVAISFNFWLFLGQNCKNE